MVNITMNITWNSQKLDHAEFDRHLRKVVIFPTILFELINIIVIIEQNVVYCLFDGRKITSYSWNG